MVQRYENERRNYVKKVTAPKFPDDSFENEVGDDGEHVNYRQTHGLTKKKTSQKRVRHTEHYEPMPEYIPGVDGD